VDIAEVGLGDEGLRKASHRPVRNELQKSTAKA
jgi:hypothetical protein